MKHYNYDVTKSELSEKHLITKIYLDWVCANLIYIAENKIDSETYSLFNRTISANYTKEKNFFQVTLYFQYNNSLLIK